MLLHKISIDSGQLKNQVATQPGFCLNLYLWRVELFFLLSAKFDFSPNVPIEFHS